MNILVQFLLYNLLPSTLIGLLAWLVVVVALKLLPIYNARMRLGFLGVPVIKSALVLLGVSAILPWPDTFFGPLQRKAVPLQQALPYLLIWSGTLLLAYSLFVRWLRHNLLQNAGAAKEVSPRLEQSLLTNYYNRSIMMPARENLALFLDA